MDDRKFGAKSSHCHVCGFEGEIKAITTDKKLVWHCPKCGNEDQSKMDIDPTFMEEQRKQYKKERRKVTRRNVLIIGLVVVIILLLLYRCTSGADRDWVIPNPPTHSLDPNAKDPTVVDKQAEIDKLNELMKKGEMTASINTSPVFYDGTSEGNLFIINKKENNYPQVVRIYKATKGINEDGSTNWELGDKIYESGLIPVGKSIEYAKLNVDLPKGEYTAIASVFGVTEETELGPVNIPLKISVKN